MQITPSVTSSLQLGKSCTIQKKATPSNKLVLTLTLMMVIGKAFNPKVDLRKYFCLKFWSGAKDIPDIT